MGVAQRGRAERICRVGSATLPEILGGRLLDSARVGCINRPITRHAVEGRATVRKGRSINLSFHLILTYYLLPSSMVAVHRPALRRQASGPCCVFSHRPDGPRTRGEALLERPGMSSRGHLFIATSRSGQGTENHLVHHLGGSQVFPGSRPSSRAECRSVTCNNLPSRCCIRVQTFNV